MAACFGIKKLTEIFRIIVIYLMLLSLFFNKSSMFAVLVGRALQLGQKCCNLMLNVKLL